MKKIRHTAFYIAHNGDKDWLINQIMAGSPDNFSLPVNGLKGEIFSNNTLLHFIDEEIRHDHFEIVPGNNNTLTYSSSGEQRKALLSYIVAKEPGYIVIDNVFESLDKDSRLSILSILKELASSTLLLQVFNRKNELLPFIETVYSIEGRSVIACQDQEAFIARLNLKGDDIFTGTIPPSLNSFKSQNGPLVKMNNVSVQFNGRPVLQNISWEINAGEFWHLTGPNGSGKTTLLSLITGNSPKGYGQDLVLFGHRKGSGESVWEIKEKIGYFTPSMTLQFERQDSIEQMIISGFFDSVGLYIKPSDRQVQLAREWLSVIGMHKDKSQPFRMFPAGHQRMILIARAMVKHPPLLILDEPTSGLDDEMAALFTALINKIAAETCTAILYVSHREEAGLSPGRIFELLPSPKGSHGQIQK
ncbi:MAG: ATP-binding cassette domain-containing protein [Ferruginibacter sp.]